MVLAAFAVCSRSFVLVSLSVALVLYLYVSCSPPAPTVLICGFFNIHHFFEAKSSTMRSLVFWNDVRDWKQMRTCNLHSVLSTISLKGLDYANNKGTIFTISGIVCAVSPPSFDLNSSIRVKISPPHVRKHYDRFGRIEPNITIPPVASYVMFAARSYLYANWPWALYIKILLPWSETR